MKKAQEDISENAENIDPNFLNDQPSPKRKRGQDDDESSLKGPAKASKLNSISVPLTDTKLFLNDTPMTLENKSENLPKPVGRSPKKTKSCNAFGHRTPISSKSRPGLHTTSKKTTSRPFCITKPSSNKPKPAKSSFSSPSAPRSWFFEIHVDSEQDQSTTFMLQSTCILDLSDNEEKRKRENRGKENVPPSQESLDAPVAPAPRRQVAAPRRDGKGKDIMTVGNRSPLGELNARDYYGEGCDAFSYDVVYDDESEKTFEVNKAVATATSVSQSVHKASKA